MRRQPETAVSDLQPCPLCGRAMIPGPSVNEHHPIPRKYGGRATVTMHRICHDKIHAVLSERELRDAYHDFDALRGHPELARFIRWVARKHPEFYDGHSKGKRR